jgi:3-deoxy-manno-octulosonate cytidylyltransferase (CMP-KDO synthetase)
MQKIAIIPARYAATRFPAKLMQLLGNKTVIRHTYDNTVATNLFDAVWVVTDSEIIFNEIKNNGGNVKMSKKNHESGSDRIAEAIADMDVDIIVNVQGDEPFVQAEPLKNLLALFNNPATQVASLMENITNQEDINNPNNVKVVVDLQNNALLFSRSVIPFAREKNITIPYYKHIGIYAYKKNALMQFTTWPISPLEAAEKIECLRYLENGIGLKMQLTKKMGVGIDTPEDLIKAIAFLNQQK